ncbi:MAG: FAD-dependent oxidoreductase [Erysipelotrichaceae bacterium]|nr:FAD-dependent oxidoreductase [Erysipelotrichaceae bacterium]
MKKLVKALLSVMLIMSLGACSSQSTETTTTETTALYKAGTYTGVGEGRNGEIKVDVVFTDDAIESVTIAEHGETEGISDPAIEKIPAAIVEAQSLGIDAVTGATMTSNGILDAVADAVEQAGGDVEALKAVAVETTAGEAVEETVDVVIVGAGGAGMAAAASALENGATVIVLEKTAAIGGNTLASGMAMNCADPEVESTLDTMGGHVDTLKAVLDEDPAEYGDYAETLKVAQEQIKEYLAGDTSKEFDSVEWHIIQTYTGGLREDIDGNVVYGQYDLVKILCENALDTYKWLGELGAPLSDKLTSPVGSLWLRGHGFESKQGAFDAWKAFVEGKGGTIMLETKAEHLIIEDGAVTGVEAVKADGTPVTVHANATIITTGGFGANEDMVREYNTYWPAIPDGVKTTCVSSATGDGINLGLEANAQLIDMGLAQLMPTASAVTGQLADGLLVPSQNYVFVNQEGERYVNEYAARDTLSFAALEQTNGIFYHIVDDAMIPNLNKPVSEEDMAKFIEAGIVYKADTLEELAELIDVPADTFVETITKYNSYVDAGSDPDFGKNAFGPKIETAPFYAVPEKPAVHHTMGGLAINTNTEVLDTDGNVIDGLYAAGEVTGGIHAGNRVGGNAVADAWVFGKIAGANAAK